ncbi:isochorismate synthase [Formosa sp. Hel1_31_208]|uniref:chorismate-binding protein n=1 Tax=Formosa sp. Hel1_31_208 TaxID=1798225 RepID=UPI00087CE452|nr:chorismate-binding protein [Formosa sp. Hel1_31_208]SDS48487.1 isochorismate synthase [Formosa sp. Hel1_31_208]
MLQTAFFSHIETQYLSQLPFVAYRKPNEKIINAILQNNDTVYEVTDFKERGFVFAPFNLQDRIVIFPLETSQCLSAEFKPASNLDAKPIEFELDKNTRDAHLKLIQKGINDIKAERFKKVVLSRVEKISLDDKSPIELFESLLQTYPSAFVYLWYHPGIGLWLGATPEILLSVEGQRFNTMALAGTQPYANSKHVSWDAKNIEEQRLVTHYITETLKPYTDRIDTGEVQTAKAGQLLHLKTKISGVFQPGALKDVITHLHPTPAVCGMPLKASQAFILAHENYNREYYTGFLGELNFKTAKTRNTNRRNVENSAYQTVKLTTHLYVNLRCMQLKQQDAFIYTGGGITKDSNAIEEWEETVNKAQTMLSVLKN